MATATEILVSVPEEFSNDASATASTAAVEQKSSQLIEFIDNLVEEGEYDSFAVVDDNARMHRTQSYYRIELTSTLLQMPTTKSSERWCPQNPVMGSTKNTKDRWGLVKKNSSVSLGENNNNSNEEYDILYPEQSSNYNNNNSDFFLKMPNRRGSLDNFEFNLSPTGSTGTVDMAIEISTAPTTQQKQQETASSKKNKSSKENKNKYHKVANNKSKRDIDKEKKRKERKAKKKKKKEQDQQQEHFQEQLLNEEAEDEKKDDVKQAASHRERRNPQKWDALLHRSESCGQTPKIDTSKRKSAPSVFSPMCKSMALPSQPSRTFSPPYTRPTVDGKISNLYLFDGDDDDDEAKQGMLTPNLLDDDDDHNGYGASDDKNASVASDTENNYLLNDDIMVEDTVNTTTTEIRTSVASYDDLLKMKQRPPVPPSATSEDDEIEGEDEDDGEEESIAELSSGDNGNEDDSSSSEYEVPLPPMDEDRSAYTDDKSASSNHNSVDASHRSVDSATSVATFQRKPPTHTNSFELTHRRSVVRHSMKRRVVKMTPQDLQSRIMDIQLTDEQQLQEQFGDGDNNDNLEQDEEQDADGVPIHPPTLCDNDYTSSAEDEDFE